MAQEGNEYFLYARNIPAPILLYVYDTHSMFVLRALLGVRLCNELFRRSSTWSSSTVLLYMSVTLSVVLLYMRHPTDLLTPVSAS